MWRQELFVNPEIAPDDDPWEIGDYDDANIEWAQAVAVAFIIVGVVMLVAILGGCLFFASMVVVQWP